MAPNEASKINASHNCQGISLLLLRLTRTAFHIRRRSTSNDLNIVDVEYLPDRSWVVFQRKGMVSRTKTRSEVEDLLGITSIAICVVL